MSFEPLPGGWSGENFLATVGAERHVVRIYSPERGHRERAAEVDAALVRLLRGLVPVPDVLEVRQGRDGQPPLLVTRYVEGPRADDVLRQLVADGDVGGVRRLGERLGRVAAVVSGIATTGPGRFVGPDLVPVPGDPATPEDLVALVEAWPGRLALWEEPLRAGLLDVALEVQSELDEAGRTSLVHGDLVPKNVVLVPDTHRVAALVDLEHAHSGSPYADLGSLVRFDRHPAWEDAVTGAWGEHRDVDASTALDLARGADLLALVDLASRPGGNLVVDLADVFLREIARTGNRHAHP